MIRLEKSDTDIWTITLDRPEKANSLTPQMLEELVEITHDAQAARGVILTGTGKVFSAGADLDAAKAGLATSDVWERLSGNIAQLDCLTIAALNGTLAGGAMGMALACDIRLSVPTAKFFYPVMKLGFLPQPSDPIRMAQLIGPSRSKMILMAGQKIDAQTAYSYGLIDRIVDGDELLTLAADLMHDSSCATLDHARAIKGMIDQR